ncbi:MAG: hypothetical protein A2137_02580 [Chloroflexi bacterium RBG_16_58_8]|nr:MAG: hypothetical protein A2137_02580 [Chloroflexi bacterium RBG_16_58_8]
MKSLKRQIPSPDERQRVLVIDDDRDMLEVLFQTLKLEGFEAVIVADSAAALTLLDKIKPDVVILDTDRPANDGIEVIDSMRERSDVPIIVLTQDNEVESLRQAISHGADDYVRKPFGAKSFAARIRAKIRRAQLSC